MSSIDDIKKALEKDKAVIGTAEVVKGLKTGTIAKVFISENAPKEVKEELDQYAKLAEAEVVQLEQPNDELGAICKKPFSISVLGIAK